MEYKIIAAIAALLIAFTPTPFQAVKADSPPKRFIAKIAKKQRARPGFTNRPNSRRVATANVAVRIMKSAQLRWHKGRALVRSAKRYQVEKRAGGPVMIHFE